MNSDAIKSQLRSFSVFSIFALILLLPTKAHAIPARFAVGPDSNQQMLVSALNSAQQELLINIYQIDTPAIVAPILDKINQGLSVTLLVESSPVGGRGATEAKALNQIKNAMLSNGSPNQHLYLMGARSRDEKRRFRFDHAKYLVIDSQRVYVSSENFTSTGHADAGKVGNRGWDTVLDDSKLAGQLMDIFQSDIDPQYGDILEYEVSSEVVVQSRERSAKARTIQAYPAQAGHVDEITLVTSPNSLEGVLNIIRSARQSLKVEEMSIPLNWRESGTIQDPLVTEIINAAERGVRVQVLLNDDQVFNHSSHRNDITSLKGNEETVQYLGSYAKSHRLPLEARIINISAVQITYIHNKGIIADDQTVFVSSINGTHNSITNNREVGVVLGSRDAAAYFTPVFDFDWSQSGASNDTIPQLLRGINWISSFFL